MSRESLAPSLICVTDHALKRVMKWNGTLFSLISKNHSHWQKKYFFFLVYRYARCLRLRLNDVCFLCCRERNRYWLKSGISRLRVFQQSKTGYSLLFSFPDCSISCDCHALYTYNISQVHKKYRQCLIESRLTDFKRRSEELLSTLLKLDKKYALCTIIIYASRNGY